VGWNGDVWAEEYSEVSERLEMGKQRFLSAQSKPAEENEQCADVSAFEMRVDSNFKEVALK
jgi:hypothetical protein